MAESGFDFSVELSVTADMGPFREQLRQGIDEAQKAGASVPVGGGAKGTAAAPGIVNATTAGVNTLLPTSVAAAAPNAAVQLAMQRTAAQAGLGELIRPVVAAVDPWFRAEVARQVEVSRARREAGGIGAGGGPPGIAGGGGNAGGIWQNSAMLSGNGWGPAQTVWTNPGGQPQQVGTGNAGGIWQNSAFFWAPNPPAPGAPPGTPSPGTPPAPVPVPAPAQPGSPGSGQGGGQSGPNFWRDSPRASRMLGLGLVGTHEVIRATKMLARADLESSLAEDEVGSLEARIQGIRSASSGFFGSIAGEILDLGGVGPEARERELMIQSARLRGQRRTSDILYQTRRSRTLREAGTGDRGALAEIQTETADRQREITEQVRERGRELAAGSVREASGMATLFNLTGYTGDAGEFQQDISDPGLRQAKRSEIVALQQQSAEIDRTSARAEARVAQAATLRGVALSSRGEAAALAGASPRARAIQQLRAEQIVERLRTQAEHPEDLGMLDRVQSAERGAQASEFARHEAIRDIESAGAVRASELGAQGRTFEAGLESLRARGAASAYAARNDNAEWTRRMRESLAERQEYIAGHERQQAGMQRLIARDPLGAIRATVTDPVERRLREQQFQDAQNLRTGGLEADEAVTGLEAIGQEKTAQGEAIRRRAEIAAQASRQAGEPARNQALIMQAAANQEQAYLRDLKRRGEAGSVMEVSSGQFGPGGGASTQQEPVVDAIRRVEQIAREIGASLAVLTGGN